MHHNYYPTDNIYEKQPKFGFSLGCNHVCGGAFLSRRRGLGTGNGREPFPR